MLKIYKHAPGARTYNSIPPDVIAQEVADFQDGLSQRQVCEKYSTARSSFQNHLKIARGEKIRRAPGGQTVLTPEEESTIVQHLLQLSQWGFPFDTLDFECQ